MSRGFAAPLCAVDTVTEISESELEAVKRISATDPYLPGHYPGFAIYPGVFTIETVYQAMRLAVERRQARGARLELVGIVSVRFTAPLRPGDELTARCTVTNERAEHLVVNARCHRRDGAQVARMTLRLRMDRAAADA